MKKIIYLFVMLFVGQMTFAKDKDLILKEARQFALEKNYEAAIKSYKSYVKLAKDENLKNVYFEYANCYYNSGNNKKAIKTLKTSIKKYGLTEEDFMYNKIIDPKLSDLAWVEIYDDYFKLRNKYITYQDRN
ncbi:tetratricopeptide repeat protein [Flavobacterium urocaniciphilum]|uniref:Tetratricopeptide repeat-containing protein n=1 Tax=Flavobacterium urocaniciphilum TaxID=1299341 RepID=A0A1H9CAB1_9FLAO|nr:tetratricopeptide repeat protein [Flavobacterium urocaniciphilum]SEP98094.1 Tetratricopeptide repeat-containing protein [Flavobacterium urocaniciphilum]